MVQLTTLTSLNETWLAASSYGLCRGPLPHVIQNRDELGYFIGLEHAFDPSRTEINERSFIQPGRVKPATLGQMVYHQIHELNLVCIQASVL